MLQRNGEALSFTKPELHKIVHDKRARDINDLKYLLNVAVNRPNADAEHRRILEDLIVNEQGTKMAEEDEEAPKYELTGLQKFGNKIQFLCQNPDIFWKYKKDFRETMELSAVKTKEYKDKKKKDFELKILAMTYVVNGIKGMTTSEINKLKIAGIYQPPKPG